MIIAPPDAERSRGRIPPTEWRRGARGRLPTPTRAKAFPHCDGVPHRRPDDAPHQFTILSPRSGRVLQSRDRSFGAERRSGQGDGRHARSSLARIASDPVVAVGRRRRAGERELLARYVERVGGARPPLGWAPFPDGTTGARSLKAARRARDRTGRGKARAILAAAPRKDGSSLWGQSANAALTSGARNGRGLSEIRRARDRFDTATGRHRRSGRALDRRCAPRRRASAISLGPPWDPGRTSWAA